MLPCVCVLGFDELLTPAEKAKLYTAIGYSENAVDHNLPKDVSHFLPDIHLPNYTFPSGSPYIIHTMLLTSKWQKK